MGGMLEEMMPFTEEAFLQNPTAMLFQNSHPVDITHLFAFTNYWVQFYMALPPEKKPHVHATIYLRMLNKNKEYRWVMVQYADSLFNQEGKIVYGLTLVTDISHIKQNGDAMMSILDTSDQRCQQFYCIDQQTRLTESMDVPEISKREQDVLLLLIKGYSSKQIAAELNIAVKTTDHHRQSLLRKTNTKTTGELVAKAISYGLI
jgi:DNA-binding CsgD family transcriptional regulator